MGAIQSSVNQAISTAAGVKLIMKNIQAQQAAEEARLAGEVTPANLKAADKAIKNLESRLVTKNFHARTTGAIAKSLKRPEGAEALANVEVYRQGNRPIDIMVREIHKGRLASISERLKKVQEDEKYAHDVLGGNF